MHSITSCLMQGFSVLLYGLGSKQAIIQQLTEKAKQAKLNFVYLSSKIQCDQYLSFLRQQKYSSSFKPLDTSLVNLQWIIIGDIVEEIDFIYLLHQISALARHHQVRIFAPLSLENFKLIGGSLLDDLNAIFLQTQLNFK